MTNIPSEVTGVTDTMLRVRRRLHEHPELSNQEFETTELLRAELEHAGLPHIRPVGDTGLVVDVSGPDDRGIVALRADIDALPIHETADVPFRSRRAGVMHACGHDVHTAMVLGAVLAANASGRLPGTIRAVFQPAEEDEPLGARSVISGGHLAGVAAMLALHVDPDIPTGWVRLRDGPMMASSDVFEASITGRNSHAGWPHRGADAIAASSAFVQQAFVVLARRVDPRTSVALNFGSIVGGTASNVLADRVVLRGVLRTLDEDVRPALRELLRDTLTSACRAYGASGEITFLEGEPVLRNDPTVSQAMRSAATHVFGDGSVRELAQPTMSGEDFAFYGAHVPTSMAWIGCRDEARGFTAPLHHPAFAVDEAVMPGGAAILLQAALCLLEQTPNRRGHTTEPI
jgi:amidohydrolase